jgi:DICT domain-containing protein
MYQIWHHRIKKVKYTNLHPHKQIYGNIYILTCDISEHRSGVWVKGICITRVGVKGVGIKWYGDRG